jgi:hypothetical protein
LGDQENGRTPVSESTELETTQLELTQTEPSAPDTVEVGTPEPDESEPETSDAEAPLAATLDQDTEEQLAVSPQEPVHFPPELEETGPATESSPDDQSSVEPASVSLTGSDEAPGSDSANPIAVVPPLVEDEDPTLDNTSEMVGQLWTAGDSTPPLDVWTPDAMNRQISSTRHFRWTSLLGIVAVVALIVVGLVLLPTITQRRADDHRDMFTAALSELRAELPGTQTSLAIATDPTSTSADLAGLATQLTVLTAKASSVDAAAQQDLPAAPPLTSRGPIDELEPLRQRIEPLGSAANTIQRRIANLVAYRTLMEGFLDVPDLPIAADSSGQAELRVILAAAQADSAAVLAGLPDDVALADHRAQARTLNERFATWQVDYLESLRTEDSVAARTLLAELGDGLTALDNQLVNPLAQIRRDTDSDLIDLASSIDGVVLSLAEDNAS